MSGSKNCGILKQWNSMQQKEGRRSYPLQQHGWNWRAMLNEISQVMKEKYHMISPFTGTIIKDTWTVTRGGWKQEREVGRVGVVGRGGEKSQKTVLEQQ